MGGRDRRAVAIMHELNIKYAHALRLMRAYCTENARRLTADEIIFGTVAAFRAQHTDETK